jgi:transposase
LKPCVTKVRVATDQLAAKDFKLQALTHELAYYKRLRFSPRTEALAGSQHDLFREDVDTDLAAIAAELASWEAKPRTTVAKRTLPVMAASRCRHIRPQDACRAGETVTAEAVPPAVIDGGLAAQTLFGRVARSAHGR